MDPDAAYEGWLRARSKRARREYRQALLGWLRGGGFEPRWTKNERAAFFRTRNPEYRRIRGGYEEVERLTPDGRPIHRSEMTGRDVVWDNSLRRFVDYKPKRRRRRNPEGMGSVGKIVIGVLAGVAIGYIVRGVIVKQRLDALVAAGFVKLQAPPAAVSL